MKTTVFTSACLFVLAAPPATNAAQGRLYDCAANTLYMLCKLTGNSISYSRSLELLPMTKAGNSMLEFNNALKQCGYATQPRLIGADDLTNINRPCVVWNNTNKDTGGVGHFFILIPNEGMATIYDYPKDIRTFPLDYLASVLKQNGINAIPIILCELTQPVDAQDARDIYECAQAIPIRNCNDRVIARLDFGNVAEGSVVKCNFRLTNECPGVIVIRDLKADCKCSAIQIDRTHVRPGDTSTICLEASLAHKHKETTLHGRGRIAASDGSQATDLLLFVKGYAEPRVLLEPQRIDFGYIKTNSGKVVFKDARITRTEHAKNRPITRIHSRAANVAIADLRNNDGVALLDIVWDSTERVGLKNHTIEVFLGNDEESAGHFDISAFFKRDIVVAPEIVIAKEGATSAVRISSPDQDLIINGIKVAQSTDLFDVSYNNEEGCSKVLVRLTDRVREQSFIKDVIEIEITLQESGDVRLLKVPVIYVSHKS